MSPAEALRLSRAESLARKHGAPHVETAGWILSVPQLADLIDEAVAAKQKIIDQLRLEAATFSPSDRLP